MQHPVRDKLRAVCHQLKMNTLSSVVDEKLRNDLTGRIKLLPSPEDILTMDDSQLAGLRVRADKLIRDIEAADISRTHDGYVHSIMNKGLPPRMKTILPTRNWYANAKAMGLTKVAKRGDYSWTYIELPSNIVSKMHEFGELIEKEDIYTADDDKYGIEKDPHITVKYALTTDDAKEVKAKIANEKGGSAKVVESSIFEGDENDVVKMTVESSDLKRLHEKIGELDNEDKHPTYKAHATIAYVKKGTGKKYVGKFKINESFDFNHLFFQNTKGETTKIGLS